MRSLITSTQITTSYSSKNVSPIDVDGAKEGRTFNEIKNDHYHKESLDHLAEPGDKNRTMRNTDDSDSTYSKEIISPSKLNIHKCFHDTNVSGANDIYSRSVAAIVCNKKQCRILDLDIPTKIC